MLIKSIRWRLQVWHGLLLLVVLTTFGYVAHHLTFENRMRQVDQELQRRASAVLRVQMFIDRPPGRMSSWPGGRTGLQSTNDSGQPQPQLHHSDEMGKSRPDDTGRPRPDDKPGEGRFGGHRPDWGRSGPPGEFRPPPDFENLFGEKGGFYYVIWGPDKTILNQSTNAPADIPYPMTAPPAYTSEPRIRGRWRETAMPTRRGSRMLVGRDIQPELDELRRLGGLLVMLGGAVMVLGLAGGWWMSNRVTQPITDIGATARAIAEGKMDRRVNIQDTDSELGQLAEVLNNTFDRLQSAFARQAQFTADASHELRTPIAVLISEAQTALARERAPGEYRETVQECLAVAQQMRGLTDSLLDLSRFDAGQENLVREPVDLAAIAADAVAMVRPLAEKRAVTIHCQTQPAECTGDPQRLAQVATNLLTNAICYNKSGGEVRIQTRRENDRAIFEVIDTGVGISTEDLPHIFERFYRADKSRNRNEGHSGLGLAIVKAILDSHGGAITATSEIGQGSTFTVRLPRTAPEPKTEIRLHHQECSGAQIPKSHG
jgi:heavy metal sensor kinase